MLIGNYSVLAKEPGRSLGGSTVSGDRSNWNKANASRGIFVGWASIGQLDSVPDGYRPEYAWVIAIKAGGMSSHNAATGTGTVTNGNLAGGLNGVAPLTGTGDITAATMQWIIQAVAALTGTGDITADIKGRLDAVAALTGTGDITAALNALASITASLIGSGVLVGDIVGILQAVADLTATGDIVANINALGNIVSGVTGTGTVTADAYMVFVMAASLLGTGDLNGTANALAFLNASVTGTGTLAGDIVSKAFMSAAINVTGDILSTANVADAVWDALAASFNTAGTLGNKLNSAGSAANPWDVTLPGVYGENTAGKILGTPVYTAKLTFIDDNAGSTDRFIVSWFKNANIVTTGITSPTIQIVKVADGTDLVAQTAMTEIGSLGRYRYNGTGGNRTVAGVAYIAIITAIIDGEVRTWDSPIGRDTA